MKDNIAIKVDNVHKEFFLPHSKEYLLKHKIVNSLKKKRKGGEVQQALKDVSFEVKSGEFFGIVGRNGSGKSTLLKIISEIYQPTKGKVTKSGRLVPFIELGVGFNPELTGSENVYLNGAMLGFSRKEIAEMYDDIVEFAELEDFMEQKLKNYSSGMKVRLAFSIAIRADADILVLDEVLAVGDAAFQRKCYEYFANIKKNKQTVILVTHSMDTVQQFCDRAMLLEKGNLLVEGEPLQVTSVYRELNQPKDDTEKDHKNDKSEEYISVKANHKRIDGKRTFTITLKPKKPMEEAILAFGIYKNSGEEVYRWASDEKLPFDFDPVKHTKIKVSLDDIFPVGIFTMNLFIKKRDRTMDYAVFNEAVKFQVKNESNNIFDVRWKIPEIYSVNNKEIKNV